MDTKLPAVDKSEHMARKPPKSPKPLKPTVAQTAPFQSAIAAITIPGILFALGAGMISQSFLGGLILMTVSLPLLWWKLWQAYPAAQRLKRWLGVAASLALYGWVFWMIWIPVQMDPDISYDEANYAEGDDIYGIKWRPEFTAITLRIRNDGDNDISDFNFFILAYAQIRDAGISPGINVCSAETWSPATLVVGGAKMTITGTEPSPRDLFMPIHKWRSSYYRVNCAKLLAHSTTEIVFAVTEKVLPSAPFDFHPKKTKPRWAKIWVSAVSAYRLVRWSKQQCFVEPCDDIPLNVDGSNLLRGPDLFAAAVSYVFQWHWDQHLGLLP